ncbi:MAG: kappa-carrageenase [Rikenellaceae bacterium]
MKRVFITLSCTLLLGIVFAQPKAKLDKKVSDEFNSKEINFDRWVGSPSWGPWSWDESNVYQKDGSLRIRMTYDPHTRGGKELYYKSGILKTRKTMCYGYFEARIKGNHTFPGTCPAFWLASHKQRKVIGADTVTYSEIDIVEMQQMNWADIKDGASGVNTIDCNLHMKKLENGKDVWRRPNGYPKECKGEWKAPWDPRDDYHVYGVENRPDSIIWYVDNKRVVAKPNLYWHLPMELILSMGLRHPHIKYVNGDRQSVKEKATAEGFPTEMLVDWVRVWDKRYF